MSAVEGCSLTGVPLYSNIHLHTHAHTHTALPNTIGSLKTSQYHPTSALISWASIWEDVVTGYTVQVEGPDSTQEIPIRNKSFASVVITDLLPSTQYTFEVSAMKGIKSTSPTLPRAKIILCTCIQYLMLLVN